ILLGDSTLDNFNWVPNKATVTDHLRRQLPKMEILNFAVDGFTTDSILYGEYKDCAVTSSQHTHKYFEPLKALENEQDVEHIVLSVLGNDFRIQLSKLIFMAPEERPKAIEQLINHIIKNYIQVVKEIRKVQPNAKLSIVLQYTPYVENDPYLIYFLMDKLFHHGTVSHGFLSYLQIMYYSIFGLNSKHEQQALNLLHKLMAKVYRNVFNELGDNSLAIIDLASSFDYRNSKLYKAQIEPSDEGGKLIASLITHTITHHDFQNESMLYAKPPLQPNPKILAVPLTKLKKDWFPQQIYVTQEQAITAFKQAYLLQLNKDRQSYLGLYSFFARSNVDFEHATLEKLIVHAQNYSTKKTGYRTLKVMQNLGWLTEQGNIKEESGIVRLLKN
ncbi:TPA: SGNH/GDSL hydrolase family protein, partial [Legionella pneumophila]|nr:SGNH/GDSL hydrolase family protein [Legionella pneumophila]